MAKEWFENWFDSPYYHILYKGRNDAEAAFFIDNLITNLPLPAGGNVWDLCCGKGRHSIYLNKKGFRTVGTDLSANSIKLARQHENATLDFYIHDMRQSFMVNYFDAVFNLFTSFGYFSCDRDDQHVFKAVADGLKKNGLFILDYLNSEPVCTGLVAEDVKELDGITFRLHKRIEENIVIKTIDIDDKGKTYQFQEKVKLFTREDFLRLAEMNHLSLLHTFGNYKLEPFDQHQSPRLVLIFQKK
ncbi:MAG: methyltransferase domain-containing protein [Bacteroidetes bacterium]|nr:methyltransferase domain-containing protein [Bacteroidota bacterium]